MICEDFNDHEWVDGYYGLDCKKCGVFIAYGCEPWLPLEDDYDEDIIMSPWYYEEED